MMNKSKLVTVRYDSKGDREADYCFALLADYTELRVVCEICTPDFGRFFFCSLLLGLSFRTTVKFSNNSWYLPLNRILFKLGELRDTVCVRPLEKKICL